MKITPDQIREAAAAGYSVKIIVNGEFYELSDDTTPEIIKFYSESLATAPGNARTIEAYQKGLLTYLEAIESMKANETESHNRYIIQYKSDNRTKYHTFDDILYTKAEASEELERLKKTAGAVFVFRMKKAAGYY